MPLDPRAKRLLDMLAVAGPGNAGQDDVRARRRRFAALMGLRRGPVPAGTAEDRVLAGPGGPLRVRCYAPEGAPGPALPGLVFFHGGGLVAGSLDTHDALCRHLGEAGRCRVVSVDYRLAPEHRFPAAVKDAAAAVRLVAAAAGALGINPARMAVGGDSAGGTLAAGVARDLARGSLRFQLLLYPVLDLAGTTPSGLAFGQGYMLDRTAMDRDLADYLPPGQDARDPRVSPLLADDFANLPPALIHAAEYDPVRDEAENYAARLSRAGVAVRHTCHPGMIHHFLGLDGTIPYAAAALAAVGTEMRAAWE